MRFCEAMTALKDGKKVTRHVWGTGVYFKKDDHGVKSFQPKLTDFVYSEDIMLSEGWFVHGKEEQHMFCDIVPLLQNGEKARWHEWDEERYIYLDKSTRRLVMYSMDAMPFLPDFESFTAEDWVEL
jgi:hypothetical protein